MHSLIVLAPHYELQLEYLSAGDSLQIFRLN